MNDRILVRKDGHVAWLILNRPDRLNAMTIETWSLMDDEPRKLNEDRGVRCLIIAGEGRAFLTGHDVAEIREHNENIEAGKLAGRIASRAPVAVQMHKAMLDAAQESSLEAALSFETEALVQTAMTRGNLEGTRAFFEHREPVFKGE